VTLLEVCEPLLQYVCLLNRSARLGVTVELSKVRDDIRELFSKLRRRAAEAGLENEYEQVRLPLIYFVDFMIKESSLNIAKDWQEIQHEEDKFAGDEDFWELLDETLSEQGKSATERLEVFYACIGLGFTGFLMGQPEMLRQYMQRISVRIRDRIDADEKAKICPEAYEHVNDADLTPQLGRRIAGIGIALVVLVVVLLVGNVYLYRSSTHELSQSLTGLANAGGE